MAPSPICNDPKDRFASANQIGDGVSEFNLKHIASLARLHFDEKDLKVFESQVAGILKFVDELRKVNVDGVEPTSHPLPLANVFREDEVKPSLNIEEFQKHSPQVRGRFFEVPKIIEDRS